MSISLLEPSRDDLLDVNTVPFRQSTIAYLKCSPIANKLAKISPVCHSLAQLISEWAYLEH